MNVLAVTVVRDAVALTKLFAVSTRDDQLAWLALVNAAESLEYGAKVFAFITIPSGDCQYEPVRQIVLFSD